MITTFFHNVPKSVARNLIKGMIGSFNASAIAYTRAYLRQSEFERIGDRDEAPTIDDYNDTLNLQDEQHEADAARSGMGFRAQMQPEEIAERFCVLRGYLVGKLAEYANDPKRDVALSFKETLDFQIARSADGNKDALEALALAVEIEVELLKAAQLKMVEDDRADLKKRYGQILSFVEQFDGSILENDEAQALFDGFPAHVQYKIAGAVMRAYKKQIEREMMALIRGNLDAAGNVKMLRGSVEEMKLWVKSFSLEHRSELNDYTDNGGVLPDLVDEIVTA